MDHNKPRFALWLAWSCFSEAACGILGGSLNRCLYRGTERSLRIYKPPPQLYGKTMLKHHPTGGRAHPPAICNQSWLGCLAVHSKRVKQCVCVGGSWSAACQQQQVFLLRDSASPLCPPPPMCRHSRLLIGREESLLLRGRLSMHFLSSAAEDPFHPAF